MIKLLASFGLMFGSMPDSDGWVALDRNVRQVEDFSQDEERDPSIWVVFSKRLDKERFMVRFPEDPSYKYLPEGGMEMSSLYGGVSYRLSVFPDYSLQAVEKKVRELIVQPGVFNVDVSRTADGVFDILYRQEGKWVETRFYLTSQNFYVLETKSEIFHRENHQKFIASLDVIFT